MEYSPEAEHFWVFTTNCSPGSPGFEVVGNTLPEPLRANKPDDESYRRAVVNTIGDLEIRTPPE